MLLRALIQVELLAVIRADHAVCRSEVDSDEVTHEPFSTRTVPILTTPSGPRTVGSIVWAMRSTASPGNSSALRTVTGSPASKVDPSKITNRRPPDSREWSIFRRKNLTWLEYR